MYVFLPKILLDNKILKIKENNLPAPKARRPVPGRLHFAAPSLSSPTKPEARLGPARFGPDCPFYV
jgi:hypothetical protein